MGTSGSYIQLKNRGFTREELQKGLSALGGAKQELPPRLKQMAGDWLDSLDPAMRETFRGMMSQITGGQDRSAAAFRADAGWVPLWVSRLCDGYILSSKDLKRLSELFQTPALGIALYDSDVLFVSCYDAAAGVAFDCAKLPWEDYEEYDDQLYSTDFPQFLEDFCPPEHRDALRAFWTRQDEGTDAVDWMEELFRLLGTQAIDLRGDYFPEGFEILRSE